MGDKHLFGGNRGPKIGEASFEDFFFNYSDLLTLSLSSHNRRWYLRRRSCKKK